MNDQVSDKPQGRWWWLAGIIAVIFFILLWGFQTAIRMEEGPYDSDDSVVSYDTGDDGTYTLGKEESSDDAASDAAEVPPPPDDGNEGMGQTPSPDGP